MYLPPNSFDEYINIKDYGILVDFSLAYFVSQNQKVLTIRKGAVVVCGEEGLQYHYPLDKLVVCLKGIEKEKWAKYIFNHFSSIEFNTKAYKYLFKDFDFAAQYLRLYTNFEPTVTKAQKKELIHNISDDNHNFLVLSFDNHYRYIRYDEIDEWEQPLSELFQIAKENTLLEMSRNVDSLIQEDYQEVLTANYGYFSKSDWLTLSVMPVIETPDF